MKNNKPAIISFHINSATGIGGLETLMQSFHKIAKTLKTTYVELFLRNDFGSFVKLDDSIISIPLSDPKSKYPKLRLQERRADIENKLDIFGSGNIIILFNPYYLAFFKDKILKQNKIILIQSNKIEILNFKSTIFNLKKHYIDLFTVYTKSDKEKLSQEVPHNKISIIPRGCKLETKTEPAIFSKKLVAITRVREEQKNFSDMVKIVKKLPKEYSLDIYGTGRKEEIESLKQKIKNHPNIFFKGVTLDAKETLRRYSVFIMTSHFEGFGQTLIEARSQGLPVVLYDSFDAAPWVVKDKKTGFLIEPYNIDSFVESVRKLCENKELFLKFSKNSLNYAFETDSSQIEKMWTDVFSTLL